MDVTKYVRAIQLTARHMRRLAVEPGRTKRTAVRLALAEAIRAGALKPGDLVPSEKDLVAALRVSLGTVQAALRQLQQVGAITRRRGDGTRVASTEPLDPSIWHFRFTRPEDGMPLHFAVERVRVAVVREPGPWTDYLGSRPAYLRIRRRLVMEARPPVGAEMYLDAGLAPGLDHLDPRELQMINIRTLLEERFGIETAGADHRVHVAPLGPAVATALGMQRGGTVFEIHAEAFAQDRRPIYFQRIYVPVRHYALAFMGRLSA